MDEVNGWIAEFAIPVDAAALAARYKTAVTQINDKYTPLETALATAPAPRREAYESYIAAEKAAKDSRPDRMQIIYERARTYKMICFYFFLKNTYPPEFS